MSQWALQDRAIHDMLHRYLNTEELPANVLSSFKSAQANLSLAPRFKAKLAKTLPEQRLRHILREYTGGSSVGARDIGVCI